MRVVKWISVEHREKYMRRCKGKSDIFFGIEHRLRKEEMEEQFNREAKGWRYAADAARITDQKHTSGGVFCSDRQQPGSGCWRGRKKQLDQS